MAQREHIYNSKDFHLTVWHYKYFLFSFVWGEKAKFQLSYSEKSGFLIFVHVCHLQALDHQKF